MKKILAMAALTLLSTAAFAENIPLTIAASHPVQLPWIAPLQDVIVAETNKRLEAKGSENRVDWTESYSGALYGFGDTLEAVGDGLADMGFVGSLWEESKMPYDNVTYFTPFTTDDSTLVVQIFNRLNKEIPALQTEWTNNNVVFLGAASADTYHLYTKFPVTSIEDLKGRKILAPGPTAPWMTAVGAVPVNGALPTYYNQIETGVADGVISIVTGANPLKIHEVAPYVTLIGAGANAIGGLGINKDVWEGLPEDVQQVLTELGPEYSARNAELLRQRYDKIIADLEANPKVTVTTLPAAERQKWVDALPDLPAQWGAKLPEGKALLDAYMAAVREAGGKPIREWKLN